MHKYVLMHLFNFLSLISLFWDKSSLGSRYALWLADHTHHTIAGTIALSEALTFCAIQRNTFLFCAIVPHRKTILQHFVQILEEHRINRTLIFLMFVTKIYDHVFKYITTTDIRRVEKPLSSRWNNDTAFWNFMHNKILGEQSFN